MSSRKCLLVIDLQTAMFNLPRPLFDAEAVLENIRGLIDKARAQRAPVIFLRHGGGQGSPFATGSDGWQIHPSVSPAAEERVIEKHHSDAFLGTELDATLKELSVDGVVLCGLVTEGCVDTTTRRAFSLGYEVEVYEGFHGHHTPPDSAAWAIKKLS